MVALLYLFVHSDVLEIKSINSKKPTSCELVGFIIYLPSDKFAERQGFEPTTLTAYISATSLSKFQIGNETVTIFRCWACPTLTAVCLPNFRVQRYGFLLKLANI